MAEAKPAPDWERIEADYRAGLKSLREIASEHGISHVAINKRAKRDGWSRDLSAKIAAKADELVTRAEVTKSVTTAEGRAAEKAIVDANGELLATTVLRERADVGRARSLAMRLLDELSEITESKDEFSQLGEILSSGDADKLGDIYRRVIALPSRIDGVKKLSDAIKTLVELERKVLKLDTESGKLQGEGGTPIALNIIGVRPTER